MTLLRRQPVIRQFMPSLWSNLRQLEMQWRIGEISFLRRSGKSKLN